MSKIFTILSLTGSFAALTAAAANPVDFPIPLTYGMEEVLIANVTVSTLPGAPRIQAKLTDGSLYVVAAPMMMGGGPATLVFDNSADSTALSAAAIPNFEFQMRNPMYVPAGSSSKFRLCQLGH